MRSQPSLTPALYRLGAAIALIAAGAVNTQTAAADEAPPGPCGAAGCPQQLLWGDTHLHTANSGDAFGSGTRLGPEQAYRFARGEVVEADIGQKVQLKRPLDFLVVADHAEGLGTMRELYNGNEVFLEAPVAKRWYGMLHDSPQEARKAVAEIIRALGSGDLPPELSDPKIAGPVVRSVWQEYTRTAEQFNEPGRFSALIGFEWTSVPGGNNLHRVVMFRDGKAQVDQVMPFSALQSEDPEQLWAYLARYEQKTGGQVLAMPHNSNLSNGRMFALQDFAGAELDADYASARQRWEPVVEVTQIKGDSESHPFLSPNDEFADYGDADWDIGNLSLVELKRPEMFAGEYAREGLKRGLALQQSLGVNPFQFGLIGATDSHTALALAEEDNFLGKNLIDRPRADRATTVIKEYKGIQRLGWQMLAGAYAGVWATENSREAIWDAFARREVYASTGPRMAVRLFGGWSFTDADAGRRDLVAHGYAQGVPMGGQLMPPPEPSAAPRLLIAATRDPQGANLDRVQVVKGWVDRAGVPQERVYDVAWSDPGERDIDPASGRLTPVGSTVDARQATYRNDIGAAELRTVWQDPEFDPKVPAFYYLRVLEIPTPRWTTYDVARYGAELPPEVPVAVQERAYTSPIWFTPH
jgi:hypothetical protein